MVDTVYNGTSLVDVNRLELIGYNWVSIPAYMHQSNTSSSNVRVSYDIFGEDYLDLDGPLASLINLFK